MKKSILCLILTTVLLLLSCMPLTLAEEPAVIRVGSVTRTAEDVRKEFDAYLQASELAGEVLATEDKKAILDEITDRLVIRCLAEMRLCETGHWELSDNELYDIRAAAQEQYENVWQYFRSLPEISELSDADLTEYLTENDVTLTTFVEEFIGDYRLKKLLTLEGLSAEIDDASVEAFYEDCIIPPVRERYENNIPLFEEEVLLAEDASRVWVPDGYRVLYQIILPFPDELREKLTVILEEAAECTSAAGEAYSAIAANALAGTDYTAEKEAYNTNMARIDELEVEYGKVRSEMLAACQTNAEEIYARLECGEQFEDLMMIISGDNTALYHPDSTIWPETFHAAAGTLSKPGDVSQVALCDDGAHILYYARDMESGTLPMDDAGRDQLREQFGSEILMQRLKKLTDPWRDVYGVTVDTGSIMD